MESDASLWYGSVFRFRCPRCTLSFVFNVFFCYSYLFAFLFRPTQVGSGASLWYASVIRGDVNRVVIGAGTSVGDSAVLHVAGLVGNKPTIVGSNVVIGACTAVFELRDSLFLY